MANKINVKLMLELRDARISRNTIASTRHLSRNSDSDVFHIADRLGISNQDIDSLMITPSTACFILTNMQ